MTKHYHTLPSSHIQQAIHSLLPSLWGRGRGERLLFLVLLAGLLTSCFSDDTTLGDNPICEISIAESSMQSTYNMQKNDTLVITPQCAQTNGGKELTYQWEVDQKVISTDATLRYVGKELGTYQCRLIVSNADGKTFYPFTLNVNSPYEEGLTVLSVDPEGNSRLSFMLTPTDTTQKRAFKDEESFSKNNPDVHFSTNAIDMVQTTGSLIIACQGSGTKSDEATIYYLNEKTITLENTLTVPEYDDFQPTLLAIPPTSVSGGSYPILCKNGNCYEFSTTEGALAKPTKMQSNYAQAVAVEGSRTSYQFTTVFWDNTVGGLCELYNGYGPYFCSSTYHTLASDITADATANYFNDKSFVALAKTQLTDEQKATEESELIVLVKVGALLQRVVLNTYFWVYNYDTSENVLVDNGGFKMCGVAATSPITSSTPMIASRTYYSLLFGSKNRVMRWNYTTSQMVNNADVLCKVGTDDAIVTGFVLSDDQTRTYVSFYEPNQTGLNGSVWVIDTDNGTVLEQYNNICYRPVKMLYKYK